MSVAYPTLTQSPARSTSMSLERIAGLAGLTFAVLVAAVNIVIGALGPPTADANASEIVAFFEDNGTLLKALFTVIPIPVVALFVFLGSVFPRLSSASPEAAFWARVGAAGLILVEVIFLARTTFELPLLANADGLAAEPAVVEALWLLQGGAMIFNGLALTVALLGLSRAARLSGLIPAWQETMGLLAALGFFVGAMAAVVSLEGSPIGLLSLVAFFTWLVWLALISIRLIRSDSDVA